MSDITPDVKPNGLLNGPNGEVSSGRFIKVGSYFMAAALAIALIVCLFIFNKNTPADQAVVTAISITIGSFLAVAVGSELT